MSLPIESGIGTLGRTFGTGDGSFSSETGDRFNARFRAENRVSIDINGEAGSPVDHGTINTGSLKLSKVIDTPDKFESAQRKRNENSTMNQSIVSFNQAKYEFAENKKSHQKKMRESAEKDSSTGPRKFIKLQERNSDGYNNTVVKNAESQGSMNKDEFESIGNRME